ncbi:MAG: hypothetical protein A2W91_19320 [Bacteroidetes bacterium GWF2_38_335]|nr:MAG: hypothetical protein A2W91_19320 [Bacteroidetes bacterium GWF2_38_335]OFY79910.1 MAG: hypothetical protein A2281_10720 [Bacteroidetes bacterium RIFOXYA12_FULL_38_20]HBS86366.1 hypothetical protein [Bacteroidales bacterium]
MYKLFLFLAGFINIGLSSAQTPGSLDESFGGSGYFHSAIGVNYSWTGAMEIQNDGKIIIGGYSVDSLYPHFTLVRYNGDGSFDNSFGENGISFVQIGLLSNIRSVICLEDGNILASGYTRIDESTYNFITANYNSDGSINSSFGNEGFSNVNVENSSNIYFGGLQSDGKIVLCGYSGDLNTGISLIRFNNDGSLDTSFGTDGFSINKFSESQDVEAWAGAIDSEDRVITTGMIYDAPLLKNNIAVVRFLADGSLDSGFGTNGLIITSIDETDAFGNAVAIQPDNKIIIAASSQQNAVIIRYNTDGTLDNSFGTNGLVITDFDTTESEAYAITIQNDGKIIVAGVSGTNAMNGNGDFAMLRLNTDGSIDSTFGEGGKVHTDIAGGNDVAFIAKSQNDGKIVLSGISFFNDHYNIALARYHGNGTFINDYSPKNNLRLFPNPTEGIFTLEISEKDVFPVNIEIRNQFGELTKTFIAKNNKTEINISQMPAGMYFIKVYSKNRIFNSKLLLK